MQGYNLTQGDSTHEHDVRSMVDLAQAKGWKKVTVDGPSDVRRASAIEARKRGVEVEGDAPTVETPVDRGRAEPPGNDVTIRSASPDALPWGAARDANEFARGLAEQRVGRVWRVESTQDSDTLKDHFSQVDDRGHTVSAKSASDRQLDAVLDLAAVGSTSALRVPTRRGPRVRSSSTPPEISAIAQSPKRRLIGDVYVFEPRDPDTHAYKPIAGVAADDTDLIHKILSSAMLERDLSEMDEASRFFISQAIEFGTAAQSLTQIKEYYGENEPISGICDVRIIFPSLDEATQDLTTRRCGDETAWDVNRVWAENKGTPFPKLAGLFFLPRCSAHRRFGGTSSSQKRASTRFSPFPCVRTAIAASISRFRKRLRQRRSKRQQPARARPGARSRA